MKNYKMQALMSLIFYWRSQKNEKSNDICVTEAYTHIEKRSKQINEWKQILSKFDGKIIIYIFPLFQRLLIFTYLLHEADKIFC